MRLPVKLNKIFLYATAAAVIIGLLFNFIFIVLRNRLKAFNNQIKVAEAKLSHILEVEKARDVVAGECRIYQPYLEIENWDDKTVVEELLKEVERIAREAKATVINLSPQPLPETAKGYRKYKADLHINASLSQIFSFLQGVEMSKLLIKVDRFIVASKNEDGSVLKSEMTIEIAIP